MMVPCQNQTAMEMRANLDNIFALPATITTPSGDPSQCQTTERKEPYQGESSRFRKRKYNEPPGKRTGLCFAGQKPRYRDGGSMSRDCAVCGRAADGHFFGALVCMPCKSFFMRQSTYGGESTFLARCGGSCDIQRPTSVYCRYCRFQKCLSVGMSRKVRPEMIVPMKGQVLCEVCNDIANGVHFGVATCEGCKKFFRRGLQEYQRYTCKWRKTCTINPRNRNSCRYCRFQRCLHLGMSREAIRFGRRRKEKLSMPVSLQCLDISQGSVDDGCKTPSTRTKEGTRSADETNDNELARSSEKKAANEREDVTSCQSLDVVSKVPTPTSSEVDALPNMMKYRVVNTTDTKLLSLPTSASEARSDSRCCTSIDGSVPVLTCASWTETLPLPRASSGQGVNVSGRFSGFSTLPPGFLTETLEQTQSPENTTSKPCGLKDRNEENQYTLLLDELYEILETYEQEEPWFSGKDPGFSCQGQQCTDYSGKEQTVSHRPADAGSSPSPHGPADPDKGIHSKEQNKMCQIAPNMSNEKMSRAKFQKIYQRQGSSVEVSELVVRACWLDH